MLLKDALVHILENVVLMYFPVRQGDRLTVSSALIIREVLAGGRGGLWRRPVLL